MPTLKGKWYFKEHVEMPDQTISQSILFLTDNDQLEVNQLSIDPAEGQGSIRYDARMIYHMSWDPGCAAQLVNVIGAQEVSEEFYNWFTKNAVNLQPTGTWRFNKTLKLPKTDYTTYTFSTGYDYSTERMCWNHELVDIYYFTAQSTSLLCMGDVGSTTLALYENGQWADSWSREITFYDYNYINLTPEFALWFYENAHSMELKLYSECYIAETADKIRECANDNTLTFKVSDLADGVQLAYDAGYSQGTSEGGGYDTPTVTLTINRTGADDTALLLTKIYYTTYEDGAFKQKTFSNLYSSGGSVTLSSIVREAHIVIDGGSGTMTSISSPMSPMFIPYIASSLLLGRVAILSINNDCPANVTLTING